MGEHLVVPSIGSSDVACAEWSNIRRFEHFLYLLNVVNDAFNVHATSITVEIFGATSLRVKLAKRFARLVLGYICWMLSRLLDCVRLLRGLVVLGHLHSHQPLIEPTCNVIETLDSMPRFS